VESLKVVMTEMDKYPIGMSMDGVLMNDRTTNDQHVNIMKELQTLD
jgi:hypothetical protein